MCLILSDIGLKPRDPSFIGSWWLGYVIFGILTFIFGTALCPFPKHTEQFYQNRSKTRQPEKRANGFCEFVKGMKQDTCYMIDTMAHALQQTILCRLNLSCIYL